MKCINVDRIRWCMTDQNISAQELASKIRIKKKKLDAILKREVPPTLTELKSIAKFFKRGLLFFIEEGQVNESKLRTTGFRTLTNENPQLDFRIKSLIERVERQRKIFLDLREEIGENIQSFQPPPVDRNDPKSAANIIRRWLDLSGKPSFDSYRSSLEEKGILVFRSSGYIGSWRVPKESEIEGFSIYHENYPIIFVRKRDARQRELFTLAHELGHLILDGKGSIDMEEDLFEIKSRESRVNAFAGNFLVPDEELLRIDMVMRPKNPTEFGGWLKQPAEKFGVSVEVVLRRLYDLGRLSRREYQEYREWRKKQSQLQQRGFAPRKNREREPVGIFGETYVGTVLEALGSKQITLTKASKFLDNIKIKDLHKLQKNFNAF